MNREELMEMLLNYRSYRYAVAKGIAPYQADDMLGMPLGGGYGSRPPRGLDGRGSVLASLMDYNDYKSAIQTLEGAIKDVLDDTEQFVIEQRYLERNKMTFGRMEERKGISEKTLRTAHKTALKRLLKAMQFVKVPKIENLDGKVTFVHVPYQEIS